MKTIRMGDYATEYSVGEIIERWRTFESDTKDELMAQRAELCQHIEWLTERYEQVCALLRLVLDGKLDNDLRQDAETLAAGSDDLLFGILARQYAAEEYDKLMERLEESEK